MQDMEEYYSEPESFTKALVDKNVILCGKCGHKIGEIKDGVLYLKCSHKDRGHKCKEINKVQL